LVAVWSSWRCKAQLTEHVVITVHTGRQGCIPVLVEGEAHNGVKGVGGNWAGGVLKGTVSRDTVFFLISTFCECAEAPDFFFCLDVKLF
jgi:hypothetical protein